MKFLSMREKRGEIIALYLRKTIHLPHFKFISCLAPHAIDHNSLIKAADSDGEATRFSLFSIAK
jgi:hypothetical protein